jgi:hypothetical protein
MELLTEEELAVLSQAPAPAPPSDVPPPSPEVVARARQILAGDDRGSLETADYSSADIAAFLAHTVGGHPFRKTYQVFGQRELTFCTPLAASAALAAKAAVLEEASGESRVTRGHRYESFLTYMSIDPSCVDFAEYRLDPTTPQQLIDDVHAVLTRASADVIELLVTTHQQFLRLRQGLLGRAQDPNFWRTPL